MRRIAGIYGYGRGDLRRPLTEMLDSFARHAAVNRECRLSPNASDGSRTGEPIFGVCELSAPSGLSTHDVAFIAFDGVLTNRAALVTAMNCNEEANDADLALLAFLKYGFDTFLSHLHGDFALAIVNRRSNVLHLCRDRFGIRPLYYVATKEHFAFASSPRALLTLPGVSKEVNHSFVALFAGSHYRTFDNDPESSPYAAIRQVPAGSTVTVPLSGSVNDLLKKIRVDRWYTLSELPDDSRSDSELAANYRELMLRAVADRLNPKTRTAFTLSGGMDSSSVLSCARTVSNQPQVAYSTVYDDITYDESEDIKPMLTSQVSRWNPVTIEVPDLFSVVGEMVRIHEEPVATATWLSHYILCKQAREDGIHTMFGGLGGDELNAGEYEYFFFFFADLKAAGEETLLDSEIARWVQYHDHPIFKKSKGLVESSFNRIVDLKQPGRCLPDRARLERYKAALNPEYFNLSGYEPVMDRPFTSYLKNRTYQDIYRETAPCCLRAQDRHGAAFGIDTVLPFFDHELVEFMFRVSATKKIRSGVTKYLLREAMKGILPEETRTRVKKTGWNAPAHQWFVEKQNLSNLNDLVASKGFQDRGIYDVTEVQRVIAEHNRIITSGAVEENHMMFLWQLVNLELWLQSIASTTTA